jgi:hypothetical integral membrane protein (TIGR02206 family)
LRILAARGKDRPAAHGVDADGGPPVILAQADPPAVQFQTFGPAHLAVIGVTAVLAAGLPLWARRAKSPKVGLAIRCTLAALLPANELQLLVYVLLFVPPEWGLTPVAYVLTGYLPIHICPMAAFLIAWTLWRRTQWTYEFAYFWGLAGTTQALLTPNLHGTDFPSYWFFQFFLSHGGTIVAVLFATLGMGMRPRRGSLLRVFLWTNAYMLFVGGVTWLLGPHANYMFLREPPQGNSPMFFLPWPWYLLFLEAVAFAIFALLYLPFRIQDRRRRRCVAPPPLPASTHPPRAHA